MKKLLALALSLAAAATSAATLTPIQLLNPAGSTAGQAIVSNGASTAPAWANVTASGLLPIGANTVYGNFTGASASPTANAMPSCSTANSALKYTSGTGLTCGTTFALTSGNLSQFASTTSAQLAGNISDETGSGALVFGTSPTLTTPVISSIVNTGTLTLPTSTDTLVGRATTDTLTNKTLTSPTISGGTINSASVGATTPSTGAFTTLSTTSTATLNSVSTSSATISGGSINGTTVGATTASTGRFTTLTATSTITPSSTAGIVGTTTNDSAQAGSVGEYFAPTTASIALTTNVVANCTSQSLTAGDYEVFGAVGFVPAGTTTIAQLLGAISTTSATLPAQDYRMWNIQGPLTTGGKQSSAIPSQRISLASTTTVYLVVAANFATSTMAANCEMRVRRVR